MTDHIRPPVPLRCAHMGTQGGLLQPFVNVTLADGAVDFRSQHRARTEECWTDALCQVCGIGIETPAVVFGGPAQLAAMVFDEPPLHPDCALYASQACPMLAGRQAAYSSARAIAEGPRGARCNVPGCDCGGWIPDTSVERTGGPAHAYFAVWVRGYSLVLSDDQQRVHGGQVSDAEVIRVRHISEPGNGRLWQPVPDWRRLRQVMAEVSEELGYAVPSTHPIGGHPTTTGPGPA